MVCLHLLLFFTIINSLSADVLDGAATVKMAAALMTGAVAVHALL